MFKSKLFTLSFCLFSSLYAVTVTGTGYESTQLEAKKEALADLSNQISVDVKSNFETITKQIDENYSKEKQKVVSLSSNLPLKAVEFSLKNSDDMIESTATISSQTALKAYLIELKRLKKEIDSNYSSLKNIKDEDTLYQTLHTLLEDIQNFNKHKIVATFLEGENLPNINTDEATIKQQLLKLSDNIVSLKLASKILTKDIKQNNIYLANIKPAGSNEVTQLSKLLKNYMAQKLNTTQNSSKANYFLKGSYEILLDSIVISTYLYDTNNTILSSKTITISNHAYKNIDYKPTTKNFDSSMNEGFVKSGKLWVQVGLKGYNRDDGIELNSGDTVDLVIKTNKAMCYFLVGHTLKENEKFSYVLPIGSDNEPFISSITGSDVNHYITIADDIPIEAPFGSETLQIFASTFDKNRCPLKVPHTTENNDGYYVIDGTPSEVVTKTRALNFSKKKQLIEKAENSISWTSFEK